MERIRRSRELHENDELWEAAMASQVLQVNSAGEWYPEGYFDRLDYILPSWPPQVPRPELLFNFLPDNEPRPFQWDIPGWNCERKGHQFLWVGDGTSVIDIPPAARCLYCSQTYAKLFGTEATEPDVWDADHDGYDGVGWGEEL